MKAVRLLRMLVAVVLLFSTVPVSAEGTAAAGPIAPVPQVDAGGEIEIRADSFGLPQSDHAAASAYAKPSVFLGPDDAVQFSASVPADGLYTVAFDMAATESFINAPEGQLLVDGAFPLVDAQRIVFPIYYQNTRDTFPQDRYGNDALIRQERLLRWSKVILRDVNFSQKYPSQIFLTAGEHAFEFRVTRESMLLGIEQARAGNRISDIGHAVENHARPAGFGVVRDYVGHGIGTRMHEEPQIPNYGRPGHGPRIEEGMVLAIEPMITAGSAALKVLRDNWTAVTRDGSRAAHWELVAAVTADGPKIMGEPA